ncbi:MAG: SCP2 sterol-binding domain-containing protein, partial [Pirellulales bacterium]
KPDGGFDASACLTHNYREFLNGFTDWVEHVADSYVTQAFPHKTKRHVHGVRPSNIAGFLDTMHVVFQRGKAEGIDAVYHLIFTGTEPDKATVTIRQQTLNVQRGLIGSPDCTIKADSRTWLGFLRKERSIVWALLTGRVRVQGGLSRFQDFGRCFPG